MSGWRGEKDEAKEGAAAAPFHCLLLDINKINLYKRQGGGKEHTKRQAAAAHTTIYIKKASIPVPSIHPPPRLEYNLELSKDATRVENPFSSNHPREPSLSSLSSMCCVNIYMKDDDWHRRNLEPETDQSDLQNAHIYIKKIIQSKS